LRNYKKNDNKIQKKTSNDENIQTSKGAENTNIYSNCAQDIHIFGNNEGGQCVGGKIRLSSAYKKTKDGGGVFRNLKANPAQKLRKKNKLPDEYVYRPVSNYFKPITVTRESTGLVDCNQEQLQGGKKPGSSGTYAIS
jgi:hypothetical protein